MTQQAIPKIHRTIAAGSYWIGYVGTWAVSILAVLAIAMPIGTVIFDYWTPRVQSLLGQAPTKLEAKRGKL